jgi:hypothetical protein
MTGFRSSTTRRWGLPSSALSPEIGLSCASRLDVLPAQTGLDHSNLKTVNATAAVIDAESATLSGTIHSHSQCDVAVEFIASSTFRLCDTLPNGRTASLMAEYE